MLVHLLVHCTIFNWFFVYLCAKVVKNYETRCISCSWIKTE